MDSKNDRLNTMRQPERVPQLSCELCRERKVKCDKFSPCGNCRNAGATCIPVRRKRLPRGRHVSNVSADEDLRDRISKLELIITNMDSSGSSLISSSSRQPPHSAASPDILSVPGRPRSSLSATSTLRKDSSRSRVAKYVAGSARGDSIEEAQELHDITDDSSDNSDDHSQIQGRKRDLMGSIMGHRSGYAQGRRSDQSKPARDMCRRLCQVYLQQVDPLIKILHRPSLNCFMVDGGQYLSYPEGHPVTQFLQAAICYSAASSLTEEQCQAMFNSQKNAFVTAYQANCESAMEGAAILTTKDITVLQALVIYLATRRPQDRTKAVWSLVALAVRIAQSLSVHVEEPTSPESFYQKQMRKRLWCQICLLDMQTCFAQDSEPLIAADLTLPNLPRNIDDADFDPDFKGDLSDKDSLTDMTMSLIIYHGQIHGKILNYVPNKKMAQVSDTAFDWEARLYYVDRFEKEATKLLKHCDPDSSDYAWATSLVGESRLASMKLSALRPMRRVERGVPPRIYGNPHLLLELSTVTLEKNMIARSDPRGAGFRWYINVIPAQLLAIALVECHACQDAALVKKVWPSIESCFELYRNFNGSSMRGELSRPLLKLMKKTKSKVDALLAPSFGNSARAHNPNSDASPQFKASQPADAPASFSFSNAYTQSQSQIPTSSQKFDWSITSTTTLESTLVPTSTTTNFNAQPNIFPQSQPSLDENLGPVWFFPENADSFANIEVMNQVGEFSNTDINVQGLDSMIVDPAWGTWENFVNDIWYDELAGTGFSATALDAVRTGDVESTARW